MQGEAIAGRHALKGVLWISVILVLFSTSWGLCRESPFANGHFWEKDGLFLHYRMWFPEHPRRKILFIHGLGGSTFSWRYAPDFLLQEGYCIVAVDLPGFGYSQRATGRFLRAEVQARLLLDFLEFLDQTLLPEGLSHVPWCLVGHSMGGKIAFLMSFKEPERFLGVLFVDAAFRGPSLRFFRVFTTFPPLRGCWVTFIRNVFLAPSRIRRFLARAYGRKPSASEVEGYLTPLRLPGTARSLLSLVNQASSLRLAAFSERPHPPFLLLWGERDRFVPRWQAEKFREVFPETPLVVIPGASHCPMETHPEECYSVVIEFYNALALR